ncbi:MAG: YdbH domain-containing protein, partial [Candidatus Omnitrophica bacterium]|nr:YdbH domain-containing protein [Candidatus Omnitrophota bacterium]
TTERFYIRDIQYDRYRLKNLEGNANFIENTLMLNNISAELFRGRLKGELELSFDSLRTFRLNLEFLYIDLENFSETANLQQKIKLSGTLSGKLSLEGTKDNFSFINGDFVTLPPGGEFSIKDNRYLERLANQSGQALDLIMENFKNYYYNNGSLKLHLNKNNLEVKINLDGKNGKRNLDITMHNFFNLLKGALLWEG